MISNKQFMQGAKTALSDRWEKSHRKWLDEQKQRQSAQQQSLKYQSALQLQTELADIFSQMSAPQKLQQIKYTSDLVIETNDKDGNNIYRFKWTKKEEEKIAQAVLNQIKNNLNATIMAHTRRLWNMAYQMPHPDNECLICSYPFTANGFRITGLFDSLLDVELVIQT
jgi:hypothetical protein